MNLIHRIVSRVRIGKAQGSLEYIMMLSAVSIIVVIAIALMMQLKGVALHPFRRWRRQPDFGTVKRDS
jgi:hypothetical protein